jgi:Holliday junction resolvase RusA-like endonuclease
MEPVTNGMLAIPKPGIRDRNSTLLTLPIPPSANRYWRNYRGITVTSDEAVAYKQQVRFMCNTVSKIPGDVAVSAHVFRARKKGDLDNYLKCLLDALQGVIFENDSAVVEIHAYRHDDKNCPRVEVEAWEA